MDQDPMIVAPSDGVTRGDDRTYPNRGTSSGMVNLGEPYGADIGVNATNRMGSIHRACKSDPAGMCDPRGEPDRFSSSGHSHMDDGGPALGSASKSDAADDTTPDKP